jgi:alkyl sulfatase BDS1-like metallo-beta-lactamase superfamily hydrolase
MKWIRIHFLNFRKKFNPYCMTGLTDKDNKVLLDYINKEIDLFVDDADRVFNNNNEWIADCITTLPGDGIGC